MAAMQYTCFYKDFDRSDQFKMTMFFSDTLNWLWVGGQP